MKKLIIACLAVLLSLSVFSIRSEADPGDLFVQVSFENGGQVPDQVSILRVTPEGALSEFISNAEVIAVTEQDRAVFNDTGIACALNGDIYFTDRQTDSVLIARPDRSLSFFVTEEEITEVTGAGVANLDTDLVFGPDGNLYVGERASDNVIGITVPGGNVSIAIPRAEIVAATGTDPTLEGGLAIDEDFNFYIADFDSDSVLKCQLGGPCSILTSDEQLDALTGGNVNLTEPAIVNDFLYVAIDQQCGCIVRIDTSTGIPEIFITETQIMGATGNAAVDPGGGLELDLEHRLYIGDDGDGNEPNILRSNPEGTVVSVFVSESQLRSFYAPIPDGLDIELDGDMCITPPPSLSSIPTLSEWGMLAVAVVLGIAGLFFMRKSYKVEA